MEIIDVFECLADDTTGIDISDCLYDIETYEDGQYVCDQFIDWYNELMASNDVVIIELHYFLVEDEYMPASPLIDGEMILNGHHYFIETEGSLSGIEIIYNKQKILAI